MRRALLGSGFIGHYPEQLRHLIAVRPADIIHHDFEEEFAKLKRDIKTFTGSDVNHKSLDPINCFDRRGLAGAFIGDIMIDLPTAAFTLRRSPRLRLLRTSLLSTAGGQPESEIDRQITQMSERTMDQFEDALRDQVRNEEHIRISALSICSTANLVGKLKELMAN